MLQEIAQNKLIQSYMSWMGKVFYMQLHGSLVFPSNNFFKYICFREEPFYLEYRNYFR